MLAFLKVMFRSGFNSYINVFYLFGMLWQQKYIQMFLLPIVFFTSIMNICLLLFVVIFWDLPEYWYIPFYGGHAQTIFDRILLLFGLLLAHNQYEYNNFK